MSAGCGSHCSWCGGCSLAYERDELDGICAACGAGPDEPHDEDCGCEDVLIVTNIDEGSDEDTTR